jgi:PAS domain S-box-containing protein
MRTKNYTPEDFARLLQEVDEFKGGFGAIPENLVITDEDGVILYANDKVSERTGFSRDEIIGRTPSELWGNQMDEGFYKNMWDAIKNDKKVFVGRLTNRKKDGTCYDCELKVYPILNESGEPYLFIGVESDIIIL